jgi:hypothetical protein
MPTSTSNISLLSSTSTDLDSFSNLSATHSKLLNIHYKMGHLHMAKIQQLACDGLFGRNLTTLGSCDIPLCRSCAHGKQHHRTIPSHPAAGTLDISHLEPGDCVSGDQVESTMPGLVPTYRGTPTVDRYHAGTLLVDHASRLLHFRAHNSTGCKEVLQAKYYFKFFASQHNRTIKCYHTNNGVFA